MTVDGQRSGGERGVMAFVFRRLAACGVFVLVTPSVSVAQASGTTWAQRAWLSTGLGAGTWPHGSLAGIAEAWYSIGPIAAGARIAGAGQIDFDNAGEQRSDHAFLLGMRNAWKRGFIVGGVGVARAESSSDLCVPGPCAPFSPFNTTETAYAAEAHVNNAFVGVGATMFGVFGARSVRYNAFALTLDLGWFGR
jgi:hypothetical protein